MYVVYDIDHIHYLFNQSKKSKFAYKWERREYILEYITEKDKRNDN